MAKQPRAAREAAAQYIFRGHGRGVRYPALGDTWFPAGQPVSVEPWQAATITRLNIGLELVAEALTAPAEDAAPEPQIEASAPDTPADETAKESERE